MDVGVLPRERACLYMRDVCFCNENFIIEVFLLYFSYLHFFFCIYFSFKLIYESIYIFLTDYILFWGNNICFKFNQVVFFVSRKN